VGTDLRSGQCDQATAWLAVVVEEEALDQFSVVPEGMADADHD
jgi:hypothetical protein